MNSESKVDPSSTDNSHPLSCPLFLSTSSSSLKPLRERNRTNLKRRINLSRSQVLSEDFENDERIPPSHLPSTTTSSLTKTTSNTFPSTSHSNSQPVPSTPPSQKHSENFSKTESPTTPSPIHTTVTCSQVWERLASNDESQISILPKTTTSPTTTTTTISTSRLPTHISFSYDSSQDENDETIVEENSKKNDNPKDSDANADVGPKKEKKENQEDDDDDDDDEDDGGWISNTKAGFQYVPLSSQSKLVQFQFLTFARQQSYLLENEDPNKAEHNYDHSMDENDDEDDEDDEDDDDDDDNHHGYERVADDLGNNQENRPTKKRKRSVSSTDSLDEKSLVPPMNGEDANSAAAAASSSKPPRTKKPKIKDPNANFQRLNMRKKQFSHAKKHQVGRNKRNAFYRRMRNAGGMK